MSAAAPAELDGYETRRLEAVDSMLDLMRTPLAARAAIGRATGNVFLALGQLGDDHVPMAGTAPKQP